MGIFGYSTEKQRVAPNEMDAAFRERIESSVLADLRRSMRSLRENIRLLVSAIAREASMTPVAEGAPEAICRISSLCESLPDEPIASHNETGEHPGVAAQRIEGIVAEYRRIVSFLTRVHEAVRRRNHRLDRMEHAQEQSADALADRKNAASRTGIEDGVPDAERTLADLIRERIQFSRRGFTDLTVHQHGNGHSADPQSVADVLSAMETSVGSVVAMPTERTADPKDRYPKQYQEASEQVEAAAAREARKAEAKKSADEARVFEESRKQISVSLSPLSEKASATFLLAYQQLQAERKNIQGNPTGKEVFDMLLKRYYELLADGMFAKIHQALDISWELPLPYETALRCVDELRDNRKRRMESLDRDIERIGAIVSRKHSKKNPDRKTRWLHGEKKMTIGVPEIIPISIEKDVDRLNQLMAERAGILEELDCLRFVRQYQHWFHPIQALKRLFRSSSMEETNGKTKGRKAKR